MGLPTDKVTELDRIRQNRVDTVFSVCILLSHSPEATMSSSCGVLAFGRRFSVLSSPRRAKRGQLETLWGLLSESQGLDCLTCARFARQRMYCFLTRLKQQCHPPAASPQPAAEGEGDPEVDLQGISWMTRKRIIHRPDGGKYRRDIWGLLQIRKRKVGNNSTKSCGYDFLCLYTSCSSCGYYFICPFTTCALA